MKNLKQRTADRNARIAPRTATKSARTIFSRLSKSPSTGAKAGTPKLKPAVMPSKPSTGIAPKPKPAVMPRKPSTGIAPPGKGANFKAPAKAAGNTPIVKKAEYGSHWDKPAKKTTAVAATPANAKAKTPSKNLGKAVGTMARTVMGMKKGGVVKKPGSKK